MKKILITGSAGFIGMHASLAFARIGYNVVGIDNLNTYYDVNLKLSRLKEQGINTGQIKFGKELSGNNGIKFVQLDMCDADSLNNLFSKYKFDYVLHLAAQAGVRYSIENPDIYIRTNVSGFMNVLEASRMNSVNHLFYASSSSVYGENKEMPFSEDQKTEAQVSIYASTKKANESMARAYAQLHGMRISGFRFFTVYGPFGRPDMAIFKFTKNILKGLPIDVYNQGKLERDFTFIDDVVKGLVQAVQYLPTRQIDNHDNFNIASETPVKLLDFIRALEVNCEKNALLHLLPMQKGDVYSTWGSIKKLNELVEYKPNTAVAEGTRRFVEWYKKFYRI